VTDVEARLAALGPALRAGGRGLGALVHAGDPEPVAGLLRSRFPHLDVVTCADYDGLAGVIEARRPALCLSYRFGAGYPREALFAGDPVYVHVAGTGFDHLVPWDAARVAVCNSSGFQAGLMADYALAAILSFSLRLPEFAAHQRARRWQPLTLRGVAGQRATVLGTGPIGTAIGQRLRAAGLRVCGINRSGRPRDAFDSVLPAGRLAEALPETDHLVVALPRTAATRGLLSAPMLDRLPRGASVVNLARGGIIDEAALVARLRDGRIGAAALDVFEAEPLPGEHPLWEAPNTIVTPHSAALFEGWEIAAAERFLDNLDRLARGEAPANRVDPDRGY